MSMVNWARGGAPCQPDSRVALVCRRGCRAEVSVARAASESFAHATLLPANGRRLCRLDAALRVVSRAAASKHNGEPRDRGFSDAPGHGAARECVNAESGARGDSVPV